MGRPGADKSSNVAMSKSDKSFYLDWTKADKSSNVGRPETVKSSNVGRPESWGNLSIIDAGAWAWDQCPMARRLDRNPHV